MKAQDFTWVITRPPIDARSWQRKLTVLEIESIKFPCLEILARYPDKLSSVGIQKIQKADIFIITSPNSVRCLPENGLKVLKESSGTIISMGMGTTAALRQNNIQPDFTAARGISSERLLELDNLQARFVRHKKILLLAGEGGRALIQEQLQSRGADVKKIGLYQRVCPPKADWERLVHLRNKPPLFVITSQSALINLLTLIPENHHIWLKQQHVMAVSQRLMDFAVQQKFCSVINSSSTALEELVSQFS